MPSHLPYSPVLRPSTRNASLLATAVIAAVFVAGCGGGASDSGSASAFDAQRAFRDLRAQVAIGPRPSGSPAGRRTQRFIVSRLRAAGIRDVTVQRPYGNVVARIPGAEPGVVVGGAHYDTKDIPGFVGANDGASGVAVLLELARSLPRGLDGPSIDLVFFDAEEAPRGTSFESGGDRGSGQFVRYAREGGRQGSPDLDAIRAMVLFDMVGDCDLHIPREQSSDPGLYAAFGSDAPFGGEAAGVLDDHTPFIQAGVPAVDLIDFDYGPGPSPGAWWHTRADDLGHVCAASLGAVGAAALAALPAIR